MAGSTNDFYKYTGIRVSQAQRKVMFPSRSFQCSKLPLKDVMINAAATIMCKGVPWSRVLLDHVVHYIHFLSWTTRLICSLLPLIGNNPWLLTSYATCVSWDGMQLDVVPCASQGLWCDRGLKGTLPWCPSLLHEHVFPECHVSSHISWVISQY